MGGVHVGGTSDPGTDNLIVDGDLVLGGDLTFGSGGPKIYVDGNELIIDIGS
jgi:hypothetical protein